MPLTLPDLDTARLCIRTLTEADLLPLMAINGDPEVTQFLPYATWLSLADSLAWGARMQNLMVSDGSLQLVVHQKPDDEVIGTISVFHYDEASARAELGYVLGQQFWRQGFMREAVSAVISALLESTGLRRIEAEVNPENVASCRLLTDLGFVHEGRARQRYINKGIVCDVNLYGLLASEWRGS